MVVFVWTRVDSTRAIAQQAGLEASVNRLLTGAEIPHVKMVEDVLNKEQAFIAIAQMAGLARCVMCAVSHVKQLHV